MANKPPVPSRGYDFGDFQQVNPQSPPPGQNIDQELDAILTALQAVVAWCNGVIRDDGSLDPNIIAGDVGANAQLAATSAQTAVAAKDLAVQKAQEAASSAALATAIAGGAFPASSVTLAASGNIQSTNVQAALYELDVEKIAVASSGAFGRQLLGAATQTAALGLLGNIAGNPAGSVILMAADNVPAGYLACNGQLVSRSLYATLFGVIGTLYGAGDGQNTFALPDLRGEFVRGHDGGRGVDTGRVFGSSQASQNLAHNHLASSSSSASASTSCSTEGNHQHGFTETSNQVIQSNFSTVQYEQAFNVNSPADVGRVTAFAGSHAHSIGVSVSVATTTAIQNNGGTEARPRNIALLYCIKT